MCLGLISCQRASCNGASAILGCTLSILFPPQWQLNLSPSCTYSGLVARWLFLSCSGVAYYAHTRLSQSQLLAQSLCWCSSPFHLFPFIRNVHSFDLSHRTHRGLSGNVYQGNQHLFAWGFRQLGWYEKRNMFFSICYCGGSKANLGHALLYRSVIPFNVI